MFPKLKMLQINGSRDQKESTIWYNLNSKLHNHFVFHTVQYMCACFRAKEILHSEMEEEHKSMSLGHQTAGGHFGGGDTFLFYHYTAWLEN